TFGEKGGKLLLAGLEADKQPDQEQRRTSRPGLRAARGRILDWKERLLTGVAGEGLRQPVLEELRGLEHRKGDPSGLGVESVACEPGRNQGVVVRPNGSDVIPDRAVAAVALGHRAHAPAGEEPRTQELAGEALGFVAFDDAAPE